MPEIPSKTLTTKQLAAALGISVQRVNELGRRGKIARERNGEWDFDRVRTALGRNTSQPPKAGGPLPQEPSENGPAKGTLLYEQWRLTREKADREELDRKVLEGALLKRAEVKSAVSAMLERFRSRVLTIADELCDRLASETDSVRCREMVDRKLCEALSQLSEYPANAA